MTTTEQFQTYYDALNLRDRSFAGQFIVGVRTTGIFCEAGCPARLPAWVNCEFFDDARSALLAGYRPCKRCRPMSSRSAAPEAVEQAINEIEAHPKKDWQPADFEELGINIVAADLALAGLWAMTIAEYVALRRTGMAEKKLTKSSKRIDDGNDESIATPVEDTPQQAAAMPTNGTQGTALRADWIETPIGAMVAVADEEGLLLLEFAEARTLEGEVERMQPVLHRDILPMGSPILQSTSNQIQQYFTGRLKSFDLPLKPVGTPFQRSVWDQLLLIPYGDTISYADLARILKNPNAFRAVGSANGANPISIIIPCHRVVNTDGKLGGYAGGLKRKEWLLGHERKNR